MSDEPTYPAVGDLVRLSEKSDIYRVEKVFDDIRYPGFKRIYVRCTHPRHQRLVSVGSWHQLILEV